MGGREDREMWVISGGRESHACPPFGIACQPNCHYMLIAGRTQK